MKLQNRVVLVTGGSKGIGAAIAVEAAFEGADVIINYSSDRAGAENVLAEVKKAGRWGLVYHVDVDSKVEVDEMVAAAGEKFGKVDVLVNNAGIALWKPFLEIDEDNWDRTSLWAGPGRSRT